MPLIFNVTVTPNAAKYRWKLDENGTLKCYLTSPALEGRANTEFIKKLAKLLGLAPSHIRIITGETTRIKKIFVESEMSHHQFLERLSITTQANKQMNIFEKK